MTTISLEAYGLLVDENHVATMFFPASGDETAVMLTAALQSDPSIVLDQDSDIPNTYRYSVFVGDEYAGKLYQKIDTRLAEINAGLQNSPKVVWIQTDYPVVSSMTWRYEDGAFIRNEA